MPKEDSIEKLLKYAALDGVGHKQKRVIKLPKKFDNLAHKFLLEMDIWRGKYNIRRRYLWELFKQYEPFPDHRDKFYEDLKKYLIYNKDRNTYLVNQPLWIIRQRFTEAMRKRHEEDQT